MADGLVPIAILDSSLAPGNLPGEYLLAAQDALNPDDPISDPLGHGTQMALIAAGVVTPLGAKNNTDNANTLIAIRTFDKNGYNSSTALMQGIDYALAIGYKADPSIYAGTSISAAFAAQHIAAFLSENYNSRQKQNF